MTSPKRGYQKQTQGGYGTPKTVSGGYGVSSGSYQVQTGGGGGGYPSQPRGGGCLHF